MYLIYVRRLTACTICSDIEVARSTSTSPKKKVLVRLILEGVAPGHWRAVICWSGHGWASFFGVAARPVFVGIDRADPGVAGASMAGLGGVGCQPPRRQNRDKTMGGRGCKIRSKGKHWG